jgi:GT2 family glycosyltransferase
MLRHDSEYDAVIGSYDTTPLAGNLISQYKNLLHHYMHQHTNREACTFWTGCGAIRAKPFQNLGGFEECFERLCVEDIEFGTRLQEAGGRICLAPEI